MYMDTTKQTEETKIIVVDDSLNKYKSQHLPQDKIDIALRYMESGKKAADELREQHHQKKHGY